MQEGTVRKIIEDAVIKQFGQPPKFFGCDICGHKVRQDKCKIICPNCGYTRDCSDP